VTALFRSFLLFGFADQSYRIVQLVSSPVNFTRSVSQFASRCCNSFSTLEPIRELVVHLR